MSAATYASADLPRRRRVFRLAFPSLQFTIRTARSDGVSQAAQQGDGDLGLWYFAGLSTTLVSLPMSPELLMVAATLAGQAHLEPAMLADQSLVSYPLGSGASGEPFARLLFQKLGLAGIEPGTLIEIDNLTAQKRLIEAGFGIGMLPVSAIEEELRLGTLVVLPVPRLAASVSVVAIHRRDSALSPTARHLLAVLRDIETDLAGNDQG